MNFTKTHRKRRVQPGFNPQIARYWADRGIKFAIARLDDRQIIANGNPPDGANASGVGLSFNGSGQFLDLDDQVSILSKDSGTMLALFSPTNLAKADQYVLSARSASRYYLRNHAGALQFGWAGSFNLSTTATLSTDTHTCMLTWSAANSARCYFAGEEVGSSTLTATESPSTAGLACLSNDKTNGSWHAAGDGTLVAFGSEGLSAEDAKILEERPWSLFEDQEIYILGNAVVGGGNPYYIYDQMRRH